jgi:EKC/KEOPS complex subunit PCC1/LAGE3
MPALSATTSGDKTVLRTEYRAKTNRMLRVAVNGFMESLGVVLGVMERLDVDVLANK